MHFPDQVLEKLGKTGRLFYCMGLVALGLHQLILKDFRSEILPPFPAWAHHYLAFPILAGVALIVAGVIISGLFNSKFVSAKRICLYTGFCFLVLSVTCHLPYILFFSTNKVLQLDVWFGIGEALAYSGGAFAIAGYLSKNGFNEARSNSFESLLEKLIPAGRILYSILIFLFGCSHFVFADFVSTMVPKYFGAPLLWTYFVGVALIGAAIAIIFKIWIEPIAFLLGIMIFLFFIFFHIPDAIANPSVGSGNEIVRAVIALLFSGIALVISSTGDSKKSK